MEGGRGQSKEEEGLVPLCECLHNSILNRAVCTAQCEFHAVGVSPQPLAKRKLYLLCVALFGDKKNYYP